MGHRTGDNGPNSQIVPQNVTVLPESISGIWVTSDQYPGQAMDMGQYRALLSWPIYRELEEKTLIMALKQAIIDVNVRKKPMKREDDMGQI